MRSRVGGDSMRSVPAAFRQLFSIASQTSELDPPLLIPKQIAHSVIIDHHVQVTTRDADVGMAGGVADFGQRAPTGQTVRDECVPTMMDRQCFQPPWPQYSAGRAEPFPQCETGQRNSSSAWTQRRHKRIARLSSILSSCSLPFPKVVQRPAVPPKRDGARSTSLRCAVADSQVRSGQLDSHIGDLQLGDLAGAGRSTLPGEK